jgi:hypothetical protein
MWALDFEVLLPQVGQAPASLNFLSLGARPDQEVTSLPETASDRREVAVSHHSPK